MKASEAHASGALAGRLLGAVSGAVAETHAAVADRVFTTLGPSGAPVRRTHDAISALTYAGVGAGLRGVPRGLGALGARTRPLDAPSVGDSVGGALALGALNAAAGDLLAREDSPLAVSMHVRAGGGPVPLDPTAMAAAFPGATPRIAVFIHGLGGNEDVWRLDPFGREGLDRVAYGDVLRESLDITPVFVRYNTGRRIDENGRDLDALLDSLVACWPVPVDDVALIGHSMGGLVARAACHVAANDGWLNRTAHVVCLGSPHTGAPLAQGAGLLGAALGATAETRPWASVVDGHSEGIKDLRAGLGDVLPPEGVRLHLVSATVTRDAEHPVARVAGDLLVRTVSAQGVSVADRRHVDGAHHWTLLSHPEVADALCAWLARDISAS